MTKPNHVVLCMSSTTVSSPILWPCKRSYSACMWFCLSSQLRQLSVVIIIQKCCSLLQRLLINSVILEQQYVRTYYIDCSIYRVRSILIFLGGSLSLFSRFSFACKSFLSQKNVRGVGQTPLHATNVSKKNEPIMLSHVAQDQADQFFSVSLPHKHSPTLIM